MMWAVFEEMPPFGLEDYMKSKVIKINTIKDITELVKHASNTEGDVTLRKGKFVIDGKSIMGVFSIDLTSGATIEYPEDAAELEEYISKFLI